MVMAKINPVKPKMPTAPLPQAPASPESALPDVKEGNEGAKYKPELDNSAILENRGKKMPNITGRLELPDGILPKPLHIDTNAIKDAFTVARADDNHDGKLNADEFKKTEGFIEQFTDKDKFDRYDKDDDGYVTGKEYHDGAQGDRFRDAIRGGIQTLEGHLSEKPDHSLAVPVSAQVKAE